MKYHFKLLLSAGLLAASMGIQTVQAAKTSITIALQLEPPHLDPTSAAAGAIDSVLMRCRCTFTLSLHAC